MAASQFTLRRLFVAALVCVALSSSWCAAADLSDIERRVGKQPQYTSPPRYGLLVFGSDMSRKMWLVHAGDELHIDLNTNGDLVDAGERQVAAVQSGSIIFDIAIPDAPGLQGLHRLHVTIRDGEVSLLAFLGNDWVQAARGDARGALRFAERLEDAPIVHLCGPLTVDWLATPQLIAGETAQLSAAIGTAGLGPGSFAALKYYAIPTSLHPTAEFRFADGSTQRVVLDDRF